MKKKDKKKNEQPKDIEIISATLKDGHCNYSYNNLTGVRAGDSDSTEGSGLFFPDMQNAFNKFKAHLAVIDDVYSHSNIEIDDIDKFHNEELTNNYDVTQFKIKGSEGNFRVVLKGTKFVNSVMGRINIESPPIPLDSGSLYKWYNELKTAVDVACEEVELYRGGKFTKTQPDEDLEGQEKLDFTLTTEAGKE